MRRAQCGFFAFVHAWVLTLEVTVLADVYNRNSGQTKECRVKPGIWNAKSRAIYAKFLFTKSQFTSDQKASMYLGRALR